MMKTLAHEEESALITVSEVQVPRIVQENFQDNAGCGELVSVGEPQTHQKANSITGKYGMWFQDPESLGAPYGPDMVLGIDTVSSEVRELYAYENMEQLARGYPTKVLLFSCTTDSFTTDAHRAPSCYVMTLPLRTSWPGESCHTQDSSFPVLFFHPKKGKKPVTPKAANSPKRAKKPVTPKKAANSPKRAKKLVTPKKVKAVKPKISKPKAAKAKKAPKKK